MSWAEDGFSPGYVWSDEDERPVYAGAEREAADLRAALSALTPEYVARVQELAALRSRLQEAEGRAAGLESNIVGAREILTPYAKHPSEPLIVMAENTARRLQEAERALREIARREYIGETTDGARIEAAVHGCEDANEIARSYFAAGGEQQGPTEQGTNDLGDDRCGGRRSGGGS